MIRMGVVKYHCLKCSKPVALELRPIMQESTAKLYASMFDAKLCLDCHADSKVPELVECLMH